MMTTQSFISIYHIYNMIKM